VPPGDLERLPGRWDLPLGLVPDPTEEIEGFQALDVNLPLLRLAPFEASAALKLRLAAHNVRLAEGRRSGSIKRLA
jgi:hypothetical protein